MKPVKPVKGAHDKYSKLSVIPSNVRLHCYGIIDRNDCVDKNIKLHDQQHSIRAFNTSRGLLDSVTPLTANQRILCNHSECILVT